MATGLVSMVDEPCTDLAELGSGLRILLTDTKRGAVGARLGMAFAAMGCELGMVCPWERHPAHGLNAIRRRYEYRGADPLGSLQAAIRDFDPDLVVPTCDWGVQHLHRLYAAAEQSADRKLMECIERSLGAASSFPIVSSRYHLLMLAAEEGVAIPETVEIRHEDDLPRTGHPIVLKASGTWGGAGVAVARSAADAVQAYRKLMARNSVPWLIRELLLNRDRANTLDGWWNSYPATIAQQWIDGRPANCAVACVDGKVVAGVAVEVLATNGDCGPASLVEVVPGKEMIQAAGRIARRLKLQGFFGLDFMIERATGAVHLIEMNARCTQASALTLGTGHNLPAAMCASLTGRQEPESEPMTRLPRIAYFPKPAQMADPDPRARERNYHYDMPANEPAFMAQILEPWPYRGWLGRWLDRARTLAGELLPAGAPFSIEMRPRQPEKGRWMA